MSYFFEQEFIINEIVKRGSRKVLLQFPEGLRYFSTEIVSTLEKSLPDVQFIISGEPSWGACDIAEDEAQILGVDLIVHFGHTPYTWYYPKFPTLFVKTTSKIEINERWIDEILGKVRKYNPKVISLSSTIQHSTLLSEIKERLTNNFRIIIGKPSNPFMMDGQILGCDYKAIPQDVDLHLNVSGGVFHPIGIGLTTGKPVINLDPYSGKVEDLTEEIRKILKIRYSKIMQAFDARTWIIIQGIKVGQNRPLMVKYMEKKLKERGNTVYIMSNKVLNIDTLRNIDRKYVDAYIVTSCPRLPTDDLFSFEKPVLTPGEAKMVINNSLEPYIFPW
ncbi:diphthamide biosynthesis enzyme Dph2 [Candidatus Acidianus copahuensis]|uniref:2-(3-amino-3-carboxypropyl)histidine synthase n=1 Tax=Candidatus Acidianus copahuensis TaxID=1160895 RepID=A0A031LPM7_9CREN|nr:diphthamide biosynthesis enzyme Dph2 [Candidatus Acidianus copahuensis]EZQ06951.1 dihydrofolate reductase [Candidatus Acidianus copahuensis]NON62354.1 diphthamide biosynthesis enzyme Dph2 [Acidianus sp. RZ1]